MESPPEHAPDAGIDTGRSSAISVANSISEPASGVPGAAPSFERLFGRPPVAAASAPGRVNLIGEHTDYNGGFVLPVATPQETRVQLAPREDRLVRAHSENVGEPRDVQSYELSREARRGEWIDYVQGITAVLRDDGVTLSGFDVAIASDVPLGSGLSSSAALEIAVLRALRQIFALPLDDVMLAQVGQRAESDFVGAPVGIMDQMACSLADTRSALFLDTRSLAHELVPLPHDAALIVIDSGIAHDHAKGEYRTRRAECERAAKLLGVAALRDVSAADLPRIGRLPGPLDRRVRHVVSENARVLEAVDAMRRGDLQSLGALFHASHASMRDDYEVSLPEIDLLVELGRVEPGVLGARLTGGGFGGSVVMLATPDTAREAAEHIALAYHEKTNRQASVLVPR